MRSSTKSATRKGGSPTAQTKPKDAKPPTEAPAVAGVTKGQPGKSSDEASRSTRIYARRPASNKDRVLAQWRGVDARSEEFVRRPTSRSTGEVIGNVLKRVRLDQRQAETEIVKVWNHLIDSTLTAHAQPAGIHKGTLFVNVDSSPWLDEIVRFRRKEILTRLQSAFGRTLIQRISFRIG